ncbi:AI-2E family transporter [Chitinimonas sp. BJB300]|uniref:AI-2E family transporter n=1 Tax=Chitinimonas sp. BJB300 TaxID=1559339 RepID=UPI00164329B1|nr:AI-2E family transporter [Chitinimonas sp. BJB300]
MPANRAEQASWLLAIATLILVIQLHLLSALLAGLLVYELVHLGAPLLGSRLSTLRAKQVTVVLLAVVVVGGLILGGMLTVGFFRSDTGNLAVLAQKMAEILENSRRSLPAWLLDLLPNSIEGIKEAATHWLREHAGQVQLVGKDAGVMVAHVLIGLIVGAMLALRGVGELSPQKALAAALSERAARLADAFRRIVFAQLRISAINTIFTALYLAVALPLFSVQLPLTKTMIALTFVVGLLPVVGNLVSNTVIVVVSLAHSPQVAVASLVFLVIVHKLEYFLNARIVGARIRAEAWELLLAMLTMEAAFGIAGLVAAPIYYAYLKQELVDAGLV